MMVYKENAENRYKSKLRQKLRDLFPGCFIINTDPRYIQGIPDLVILYKNKWAALEVKKSKDATRQPNQERKVDIMDEMSFASFIYPENEISVLDHLMLFFSK